jgi:hypothetical protein
MAIFVQLDSSARFDAKYDQTAKPTRGYSKR